MPAIPDVLIITRSDIGRVMSAADWLQAAELAFRANAERRAVSPHPLHLPCQRGGFHVKAASMSLERDYVAVKVNGNFPGNPQELGLPTVQGAIVLADGSNGVLLAIIDSVEVTLRRTAAASALAAKLLARPESSTMLICGCGAQGRAHLSAMREVLPLTRFLVWDRAANAAETLADECNGEVASNLKTAALSADVIVCCTPSTEPFLHPDMVRPGRFIAAVGADNPDKSEIAPELMARAKVVADSLKQCAVMGDLHHAIAAGTVAEADVHAELADVLGGAREGRRSADEIILFDSTGTGLLDVAVSAAIYERAIRDGLGQPIGFGHS
jgi:ornithine cyclodeaminase/alanine dehydrogenase-like protein (mu-crystallin family)